MEKISNIQKERNNPYVRCLERMMQSLDYVTDAYAKGQKNRIHLSSWEIWGIAEDVSDGICNTCERYEICGQECGKFIYNQVHELVNSIDEYGNDLSVEVKRKLQKNCLYSEQLHNMVLSRFQHMKAESIWNIKISEQQKECGKIMQTYAKSVYGATREIEESLSTDAFFEKDARKKLRRYGIKMLNMHLFITSEGRKELELTIRTRRGDCVTAEDVENIVSEIMGRDMILISPDLYMLRDEFSTLYFEEPRKYQMLYGLAQKTKEGHQISGDNFLVMDLIGGKKVLALSDGMGSGESAYKESKCMIELLEELLDSGFDISSATSMVNEILMMRKEEVIFATLDLCMCDLYTGNLLVAKAGAADTYIKSGKELRKCSAQGMPLGVLSDVELSTWEEKMRVGEYLIMLTDGVEESLPVEQRTLLLETIMGGIQERNPKEVASYILKQIQYLGNGQAMDDQTVLVAGLWQA